MSSQASGQAPPALSEQSEASRTRILKAAAQIAAECGYEGTTISKVTKRSGLPVSSVYWFFRDKEHLLAEVVRHSFDEWIAHAPTWDAPPASGSDAGEVLRAILTRSTSGLATAPDFLRIGHMLLLEQRAEEPAGREIFLQSRRDVEMSIAAWFAPLLPDRARQERPDLARDLARIVIASTDGLFLAYQIDQAGDPADFIDMVVTIFEAAIAEA
ncbi:MAG: TetR/AcrR family transcriptional regulator [Nocardioides sp.]